MIKFFETETKLSEEEICRAEKEIGFVLPEVYKQHLMKHNGGRCNPRNFSFIEDGKRSNSGIEWFFAIYDGEYDNFVRFFFIYKIDSKRLPTPVFPFASDSFGNLICMDSSDEKIYFWDHEDEVDYTIHDDSVRTNLFWIADSLEEFLNNLKED